MVQIPESLGALSVKRILIIIWSGKIVQCIPVMNVVQVHGSQRLQFLLRLLSLPLLFS